MSYLPETREVIAALPVLNVVGGHVVHQIVLGRELAITVSPATCECSVALRRKDHDKDIRNEHDSKIHNERKKKL